LTDSDNLASATLNDSEMQNDFSALKIGAVTAGSIAAGAAIVSSMTSRSLENHPDTETPVTEPVVLEQAEQTETQPLEVNNELENDELISSLESSETTEFSESAVTYESPKDEPVVSTTIVKSNSHDELADLITPVEHAKLAEPIDSVNTIKFIESVETADEPEAVLVANISKVSEEPEDSPAGTPDEPEAVLTANPTETAEEREDALTASPTDEAPIFSSPVMPDMHVVRSLIIVPTETDNSVETVESATETVAVANDLASANTTETVDEPDAVLTANPNETDEAPTVSSSVITAVPVKSMIIEPIKADNSFETLESATESGAEAGDLAPAITEFETAVKSDSPFNPMVHSQSSSLVAPVETLEPIEFTTPSSELTEPTDTKEPVEVIPLARKLKLAEPTEFVDTNIHTELVLEPTESIKPEEHVEADQESSPVLIEAVTAETVETDLKSSPTLPALAVDEEPELTLPHHTLSRSVEQSAETDFTEQVPTDTFVDSDEFKTESETTSNDNALKIGAAVVGGIALAGGLMAFSSHDGEPQTSVSQANPVSRSIVSNPQLDVTEHVEINKEIDELFSPLDGDHGAMDNNLDEASIGSPANQRVVEAKKSSGVGR
jgi:hypothetical protein